MLKLTFADGRGDVPPCPAFDGPDVDVWRDAVGGIAGYAVASNGLHWVVIPGAATFCFDHRGEETLAVSQPGVERQVVQEVYDRHVLPVALQALGCEALHASGVRSRHGVLALCGPSGVGKSTLAFALGRQGHPIWADDSVVFEPCRGRALAVPIPFRLRLRPPVASFFSLAAGAASGGRMPSGESPPLAAVFLLERFTASPGACPLELRRLSGADAFVGTLRHVNCFSSKDRERTRRLIGNYLDLAASVPLFTLRFASGFARLAEVAEAFSASVDRALAPRA